MRICFLNHNLRDSSGAGRFGLALIGRLVEADPSIEPVVLTSVGCGHPWERALLHQNRWRLAVALPEMRRIFSSCDIIHALDGWPYGVAAAVASRGLGKPLVVTAIGTGAIQPFLRWYGWLLAWTYRRADQLIAVSRNTRREILKRLPGLQIAVINHGIDANEYLGDPMAGLTEIEKLEIKKLRPYVLSVGSWKERKGFRYSLAAFAELSRKFPELNYVICGIGRRDWLTDEFGVTGRVSFFQGVKRHFLRSLYKNAELFWLLPYNDRGDVEGFGFVFLEAAAAGIPVIGTLMTGAEDAVSHGENGYLVPPADPHAAAQAAARILGDEELGRRFSEGSLAFTRQMSWDRVIAQYRDTYRKLLRS